MTLPRRHKITASLSTGEMKMDHELLNISTNDALGLQPPNPAFTVVPPYSSVEAKYDTLMLNFRLTGDPSRYFGYIASYRKFELKDKTEEYDVPSTVRGDVGASYSAAGATARARGLVASRACAARCTSLPVHGLRLGLSYGQDKRNYDIREYADVNDDVLHRQRRLQLAAGCPSTASSRTSTASPATRTTTPSRRPGRARPRPTSASATGTS